MGKSNPYERAIGGKLTFKGDTVGGIDKKKKKKNKKKQLELEAETAAEAEFEAETKTEEIASVMGIDPTSKKLYEELFPSEAKRLGYAATANPKSAEEALDERVKKKADRYCK